MKRLFILAALMASSDLSQGAEPPAATQKEQKEITYLFTQLEHSGCQFNRNGTWYNAKDASEHLHKKYQYLLDKNMVSSAETFIERAATSSSMSGKTYLVKCGEVAPVESAAWFKDQLQKYRASM